jgi:hypothetical protein
LHFFAALTNFFIRAAREANVFVKFTGLFQSDIYRVYILADSLKNLVVMPNNPRLYTVDHEADEILASIQKGKRSAFVSDAVKMKFQVEKEKELEPGQIPLGRIRR